MADAKKKTYDTRWASKTATKAAVDKFEEQFNKDMGIDLKVVDDGYEVVSTGSLNLDYTLGIGGIPTGRIIEVWGPEHAGKTTLMCLLVAEYQKKYPKKKVAWVDMEQTFDPKWAAQLGVDVKAMWRPPVKTAEDTADATKRFVESGLCSLVILDSVGGMIAKMEFQKEADESTVGLVPKIVTRMVKQCSPMAKSNDTTVAVVNQVRAQIGGYGPDEITGGGWALKHVTTIRLHVRRGEQHAVTIDGSAVPVGHQMMVKVQKNKMAPWGQTVGIWLHNRETKAYGPIGVDVVAETFDHSKRLGLMGSKAGGYYMMPDGETELRGEQKVLEYLRENETACQILRGKVLASLADVVREESEEGSFNPDDPMGMADMVEAVTT